MEMKDVKVGMYVKLSIDSESKYQIIEINPKTIKPLTIRNFGSGVIVNVSASEIKPFMNNNNFNKNQ